MSLTVIAPGSLTVTQGEQEQVIFEYRNSNKGKPQKAVFALEPKPPGLTVTFSPPDTTSKSCQVVMVVTARSDAPEGQYQCAIKATTEREMAMAPLSMNVRLRVSDEGGGPVFSGTIYYVSQSGGSNSNNGTSTSTPWQTVAKVNSMTFSPGDAILFKRGDTWLNDPLEVPSSGSSGNPITIGAYGSGNKPKFNGNGAVHALGVVRILGKSWITIQDLEIMNSFRDLLNVLPGSPAVTTQGIILENCEVHLNNLSGEGWSAINVLNYQQGTATPIAEGTITNITIRNNTVYDVDWNCIRVNGGVTNSTIENNTCHDYAHNGIDVKDILNSSSRNRNITVKNNTIYNGDVGMFIADTENALVDGNTMRDLTGAGLKSYNQRSDLIGSISNNTFQRNIFDTTFIGEWITNNVNAHVYNNTIYGCSSDAFYFNANTSMTRTNDLAYGNGANNTTSPVVFDGRFVDAANGDFRLCTGSGTPGAGCAGASNAINAGSNVGLPFNGAAPDLGAVES